MNPFHLQPKSNAPRHLVEDGTIILEAECTQFKVFKGILAANSTVFNDMLVIGSFPGHQ
ncbi:hypothetical protein B0H10DRAFT_1858158 [Mycena sp. CBHHK59/15]|nr:hypothetical protein B0H10DRAFT_1858158 [Mycena sp. CBHHK59/15]